MPVKLGLKLQQALYTFLVTLLISSLITVYAVVDKKDNAHNEFLIKGQSLAALLSATLVSPLYDLKVDQIARLVSHTLSDKDISKVFVIDSEGYVLSDGSEENPFRDEVISDIYPLLPDAITHSAFFTNEETNTLIIVKPVLTASDDHLGAVTLEVSLSRADQLTNNSIYTMMSISLGAILFGLILALFLSNRQIKPLNKIKEATENIANGNLKTRLLSNRKDELGNLANAVDNMAEQLLRTTVSKSYVNRIIHTMPNGLIVLDKRGNILEVNPYTSELLNIHSDCLINRPFTELFQKTENSINLGRDGEYLAQTNDRKIPVQIAMSHLEGSDNSSSTLVVIHDISQRKRLEAEREKALEKAEESAKLKSEFLASMSHEIRTPMNGVIGMLRLLLQSALNEKQHHYATLARSSADSLLSLINDILDFSKIEAGKLDLEILDYNLSDLFDEFAGSMAHRAQDKNLELILDTNNTIFPMVQGDPGRLRQVLTNLVGNAIKFTDAGEIVIRASLAQNENKLTLTCAVIDSGIGIPEEKVATLFDSFTQVDASTTRKYGGTGLGLAIANQLCERMGSGIKVTSTIGKGSCFEFSINLMVSQQQSLTLPEINVQNTSILIIDDNETNREVLRGQLEYWGANVTEATGGSHALEILDKQMTESKVPSFQIAILDMQMPEMDGATLGKKIRTDARFDPMKLIMMTSIAEIGDANFFADLGFNAYFPKPTTTSDLLNALKVVLDDGEVLAASKPLVTHHNLPKKKEETHEMRILLVEDNSINQQVAQGILEALGFNADIAANGIEAIDSLKQAPKSDLYQVILMDCQMPEMDGYEATRKIRSGAAGSQNSAIPIIAMTANAMKGDKEHCLSVGMDDYTSKPIDAEEVNQKLKHWLDIN